jgi:hypothetical protein
MNPLEQYIADNGLFPIKTMNELQANGIVSDNCVDAADVYEKDAVTAVKWFKVQAELVWM